MHTQLSFALPAEIDTELLAVLAWDTQTQKESDSQPEPTLLTTDAEIAAAAQSVLAGGEFKAGVNETLLIHAPAGLKARRLLVVGLGKKAKATVNSVRQAAGTAVRFCKPRGLKDLVLLFPESEALPPGPCSRAVAEGVVTADFDSDTYRSDRKDLSVNSFNLVALANAEQAALQSAFAEGVIVGDSQNFTRTLVNEPGNKLTPTILGQRAAEMATQVGLQWDVYSTEKLHGRVCSGGTRIGRAAGADRSAL